MDFSRALTRPGVKKFLQLKECFSLEISTPGVEKAWQGQGEGSWGDPGRSGGGGIGVSVGGSWDSHELG